MTSSIRERGRRVPAGFFDRADQETDDAFYSWPRLVTHIDEDAIAAVGALYEELGLDGAVARPDGFVGVALPHAPRTAHRSGHERGRARRQPSGDVDGGARSQSRPAPAVRRRLVRRGVCCVSVDYLTRPVEVFADVARVVRRGGPFVCTFSNRCFPTKAIRGWLATTDEEHCKIVAAYFRLAGGWDEPHVQRRTPALHRGDPLFAVWAYRTD